MSGSLTGNTSSYQTAPPSLSNISASSINPSYITSQFANGLPQVTAQGTTGAYASPGSAVTPSYSPGGENINSGQYGAGAMTNEILNALGPTFAQQNMGLTDNLANAGIVGGSTTGALGALDQSQITQALGQLVPAQQTANTTQLGAQEFNSGQQQANNQYNTTNDLTAQTYNSGQQQANNQYNATNALNTQQYNANAANTANGANVTNALTAAGTDSSAYNNILSQILGYQNANYEQNQQDQYGLDTGAASGQQQAFTPYYEQPGGGLLSDIGAGLGTGLGTAAGASLFSNPYAGAFKNDAGQADTSTAAFGGW